ncbi:unnamed protein product [Gordionus sp. m RMFG-2023]
MTTAIKSNSEKNLSALEKDFGVVIFLANFVNVELILSKIPKKLSSVIVSLVTLAEAVGTSVVLIVGDEADRGVVGGTYNKKIPTHKNASFWLYFFKDNKPSEEQII